MDLARRGMDDGQVNRGTALDALADELRVVDGERIGREHRTVERGHLFRVIGNARTPNISFWQRQSRWN